MPDIGLGDVLDVLAALATAGLIAVTIKGGPSVARLVLTVAFTGFVPGRAIVSNWARAARWSEAAIAVLLSVAILALAATVALWVHYWHPLGLFQVEAGLCLTGLAVGLIRRRRALPVPHFSRRGRTSTGTP